MTRPIEMWRLREGRTVTTQSVRKIRIAMLFITDESSQTFNVATTVVQTLKLFLFEHMA